MADKSERPWVPARVLALVRAVQTGEMRQYPHPTRPGFYLRVNRRDPPVYGYRFRDAEGKVQGDVLGQVAEVVGVADGVTLDAALAQFERLRARHKSKGEKGDVTLAHAFARYQARSELAGGGKKAPETIGCYQEIYSRYLEPGCADWIISKVKRDAWEDVLDGVQAKSVSSARIAYWLLSGIYKLYVEDELLDLNPLAKTSLRNKFSGKSSRAKRKTHVRAADLRTFFDAMGTVANRGHGKSAVMCLALSGWRLNGVLQMRWDRIDAKRGAYAVRAHDVGWKGYVGDIVLNSSVLAYVDERRAAGGEAESTFVFPSAYGSKHEYMRNIYGSLDKASAALGWRIKPHDLRRTFATVAYVVLDKDLRMVGQLIGHKQPLAEGDKAGAVVTGDYVQDALTAQLKAANEVAEAILQLGGVFPMDDGLKEKFAEAGVDIENMQLADLPDDDEPDDGAETETGTPPVGGAEGDEVYGDEVREVLRNAMRRGQPGK